MGGFDAQNSPRLSKNKVWTVNGLKQLFQGIRVVDTVFLEVVTTSRKLSTNYIPCPIAHFQRQLESLDILLDQLFIKSKKMVG